MCEQMNRRELAVPFDVPSWALCLKNCQPGIEPVCRPIHLCRLPNVPGNLLRYVPLFQEVPWNKLISELKGAPSFKSSISLPC